MLPSSALVQEFAQSVRARGSGYIGNGSIEILSGSTTEVTALVQGSDNYFVGIARIPEGHETRFEMSCTCPFAHAPVRRVRSQLDAADNAACGVNLLRRTPEGWSRPQ